MNLNKRLILYNSATIIVPLLITVIVSTVLLYLSPYLFGRQAGYENIKNLTSVTYELLGADNGILRDKPDILLDEAYQQYLAAKLNSVGASVIILKNREVIYSSKSFTRIELQKCINATDGNITNSVVKLDDYTYFVKVVSTTYSNKEAGKLFMLLPLEGDGMNATKLIIIDGIIFILCYILTNAYYSYIILKQVSKPLKSLQTAAERISDGNLDEEIYEQGENEIKALCKSFEVMRIKLKESINLQMKYDKNRTMLLSSISHDLRTPVTTIKGYVEGILDGVADTEDKKEKYLKTIYQKAVLVDDMIDDILLYSKLDLNQLPYDISKVDIYEYIKDMVTDYEAVLIKSGISINLVNELKGKAYVMIDPVRMIRVFNNIIDNSRKYMNKSEGMIQLILRDTKARIIIEVRDNGIGIDKSVLPNIFERFYRADSARSNVSGSGLGLAICRQIVEGLGGKIWASSELGVGTSILISLPKI